MSATLIAPKSSEAKRRDHIDRVVDKWRRERPDYDLAPVEIIGRTGRIMEYVDRVLEAKFGEFGLSRATFDVLATLRRNGPPYKMTQRDLMRSLLRTSGCMSLRIDSLENQGLVERSEDQDDRRSVFVSITSKGSKLLETVIPQHLQNEWTLISGLTAAERSELASLLRKWLASLEDNAEGRQLYLGMTLLHPHLSLMKRRAVGLPDIPGLLVHRVEPGSLADDAGFKKGDLISAIEGEPVHSVMSLRKSLNRASPRVKHFRITRGMETISLELSSREAANAGARGPKRSNN